MQRGHNKMKDKFGREWEMVKLKDKKKKQKEKNNILFPTRNHTEKTVEDEMSDMFEDDRPKSME